MLRRLIERMRLRDPGQPIAQILHYRFLEFLCELIAILLYRTRAYGASNVPPATPILVISNHQSHFDPPLVGIALRRRHIVPLARTGLFGNRFFAWLISSLNAIPLKQDEPDTSAMRKAIEQIRAGRAVLIFAEGSRSPDGALQPFKRGAWLLIKRAKVPVLPVAIEGSFDAWPRRRAIPRLLRRRVAVAVGRPLAHESLVRLGPERALARLADEIQQLRRGLRAHLRHATRDRYPPPGPGDSFATPSPASGDGD